MELASFFVSLGNVVLWSAVGIIIATLFFELMDRRYKLIYEMFHENSVAAAIFAGSFILGIFYTVTQIVIN
jgi:uncharacterized membrane protein YjfL (UPF0719 family)